jgi:hypothetical protein
MDSPVACNLTEDQLQERRTEVLKTLKSALVETKELEDGYAYCFPSDESWITELTKLITAERACCPFLRFNLRIEPSRGPIWLELTGPEGTKDFLQSLFSP